MPESNTGPKKGTELNEMENPPGLRRIAGVEKWGDHDLVKERLFFTLPKDLLNLIDEHIGLERFDSGLVELECGLSDACSTHVGCIGYWDGQPIQFPCLAGDPADDISLGNPLAKECAEEWGKNLAEVQNAIRLAEERSNFIPRVSRGYAGWLLSNSTFIEEHNALFKRWTNQVYKHGIPQVGPVVQEPPEFVCPIMQDKNLVADFVRDFSDFFTRWRLKGLAAPGLPIPLQPLMAGLLPPNIVKQLEAVGGIFFLPDTFPIPSRDELRWLLEDAIRGGDNEGHLAAWMHIVRASNLAKNKIGMYARILDLQHYWRILQQRHAATLRRNTGKLEKVFASFLKVTSRVIHEDLISLRKNLRANWYQCGWSSPVRSLPDDGVKRSSSRTTSRKRKHE